MLTVQKNHSQRHTGRGTAVRGEENQPVMKKNLKQKAISLLLILCMLAAALPSFAEEAAAEPAEVKTEAQFSGLPEDQKLNAAYMLALNAINAEDYATARKYINISFAYCDRQSNPVMYADLLLKQACIDVIEGDNNIALMALDAALAVNPENADAYLVRTQVYAAQGNVDKAIENLEKYIDLSHETELYQTVAQLQEAKGDAQAAQAAYDKYVQGAGNEIEEAGFQSGLYKILGGKFSEAIADFEAYTDNETYGAGAMYNIGICKMNLKDYAGAAEAFAGCETRGGAFEGLYYNLGICLLMTSEWAAAAERFTKSIETEPYKDNALYNLALCRMQQGDYTGAVEDFTGYIGDGEADPEKAETGETAAKKLNYGAYYYRAFCRVTLGELEAAAADYTECISHGYEPAQSYYQRAQVYGAMGETEKQNADLTESLKYTE